MRINQDLLDVAVNVFARSQQRRESASGQVQDLMSVQEVEARSLFSALSDNKLRQKPVRPLSRSNNLVSVPSDGDCCCSTPYCRFHTLLSVQLILMPLGCLQRRRANPR